ncbi:MAG: energy transducer TonB [Hymenobacter sp.]|nr:MAG: energy transducer TonB [Hymenobacter sp.]
MPLLTNLFPASLDALVFEGRNQAYGAYQLRQSYGSHVRRALGSMLGLCLLLLLSIIAWEHLHPADLVKALVPAKTAEVTPIYVVEPPRPIALPPSAAPSHPVPAAASASTASFPTKIVKDELVAPKPTEIDLTAVPPGLATTGPVTMEASTGSPGGPGTAEADPAAGSETAPAVTGPYLVVEKMPEFAGGTEALMRYLRSHLRYPSAALAAQVEGRVYVSFVVQADGTIADISLPKGLGFGLDEEAQRVVRQMPAWTPGQQSHHAVPVRFTLPISFRIQ